MSFDPAFLAGLDPSIARVLDAGFTAGGSHSSAVGLASPDTPDPRAELSKIMVGATGAQDVLDKLKAAGETYGTGFSDAMANLLQSDPTLAGAWKDMAGNGGSSAPGPSSVDGVPRLTLDNMANPDSTNPGAPGGSSNAASLPFYKWGLSDLKGAMLGLILGIVGFLIIAFTLYSIFSRSTVAKSFGQSVSSTTAKAV